MTVGVKDAMVSLLISLDEGTSFFKAVQKIRRDDIRKIAVMEED